MTPVKFKEANMVFTKPQNMTDEECSSLHVHKTERELISLWTVPFWQRVKFLFHGRVWLGVVGSQQPPIWLDMTETVFNEHDNDTKQNI